MEEQFFQDRPKLGISTCLLGESVRYDGGHKLDRYLRDTVGPFVEWIPVCPEVECGLSIPREAVRLVGDPDDPRLLTSRTGIDKTEKMQEWIKIRLEQLEREDLCGFIFKTKSPSSGMRDIKVYNEKGMPVHKGAGIFAKAFMEKFPMLPVEDDGRLNDAGLRENFIERIFVYKRWQDFIHHDASIRGLVEFHTKHKYVIMSHSSADLKLLGKLVANTKSRDKDDIFQEYEFILFKALKLKATVKKNVNVLSHLLGYFKKLLTPDEKKEMLDIIDQYHKNLTPLIVPITLFKHYTRKYDESYLKQQYYLNPHPIELRLRNHV